MKELKATPVETASQNVLRVALQRIADASECECEHDTEDCCNNCDPVDFVCPGCIAGVALASKAVSAPTVETASPREIVICEACHFSFEVDDFSEYCVRCRRARKHFESQLIEGVKEDGAAI